MAHTLKVTVSVRVDGTEIPGFPKTRRLELDEKQEFGYEEANDGDSTTFSALPADQLSNIQALIVQPDQEITIRLDNQSDAGVTIGADGLLVILGSTIDAGSNRATVNNNSGNTANIRGIAGGT